MNYCIWLSVSNDSNLHKSPASFPSMPSTRDAYSNSPLPRMGKDQLREPTCGWMVSHGARILICCPWVPRDTLAENGSAHSTSTRRLRNCISHSSKHKQTAQAKLGNKAKHCLIHDMFLWWKIVIVQNLIQLVWYDIHLRVIKRYLSTLINIMFELYFSADQATFTSFRNSYLSSLVSSLSKAFGFYPSQFIFSNSIKWYIRL